jgi:hypothetical protein
MELAENPDPQETLNRKKGPETQEDHQGATPGKKGRVT